MTSKCTVNNNKGFTILELLIVAGLMLVITYFGLNMVRKKTPYLIKSESRKLVGLIQHLYNQAILTNQTLRLAIDLDKETLWVEQAQGSQLSELKFSQSQKSAYRKKKLARELKFKDVFLVPLNKKLDTGVAYIHFFQHGQAEDAIIHLIDLQNVNYTLKIAPLTGETEVHVGYH
ncbi:MAG: hypothetical protein HYW47_02105 [Deltaproteobacteria bacterium]|nr:hypothetical protein [Deltaproteobacteria bacterium]